ncbi:MAG: STAS domain-containing protein [Candidatus Cloacimonas sp.]|nr:STAS domain-containing protein [Candidatus Cloacimonadota bacterium]
MDISLQFLGDKAVMKISGSVASEDVFELQEKLNEVKNSGVKRLEMDLSNCRSMCSSGIGKVLYFYKDFQEQGGEFEIVKSSPSIYELFTTIKLNQLFDINL